ncbi:MAG TPA: hypothetical protein VGA38_07390, partial [Candidatus Limnocylindria bacterium]
AYELLTQYRGLLDAVVGKLIEQETLSSDEFNKLVDEQIGVQPVAASTPGGGTTPPSGAPAGGSTEPKRRPDAGTGKGPAPAPTPA